jgi:hypothetical protein
MLLSGRCLSTSTLMQNYCATDVPCQKDNPSSSRRGDPIIEHINGLGLNVNSVMGPETKNGCAGEGQQPFTGLNRTGSSLSVSCST